MIEWLLRLLHITRSNQMSERWLEDHDLSSTKGGWTEAPYWPLKGKAGQNHGNKSLPR